MNGNVSPMKRKQLNTLYLELVTLCPGAQSSEPTSSKGVERPYNTCWTRSALPRSEVRRQEHRISTQLIWRAQTGLPHYALNCNHAQAKPWVAVSK